MNTNTDQGAQWAENNILTIDGINSRISANLWNVKKIHLCQNNIISLAAERSETAAGDNLTSSFI